MRQASRRRFVQDRATCFCLRSRALHRTVSSSPRRQASAASPPWKGAGCSGHCPCSLQRQRPLRRRDLADGAPRARGPQESARARGAVCGRDGIGLRRFHAALTGMPSSSGRRGAARRRDARKSAPLAFGGDQHLRAFVRPRLPSSCTP